MLLSKETNLLARRLGYEGAIRKISAAGFDAFDMSFFPMQYDDNDEFLKDGYKKSAMKLRKIADECNVICNQAHAPFPSSFGDDEKDEIMFKKIVRSMEIASILGAKIIVVHPKQHLDYSVKGNPEKLKKMNYEFYTRLIPYCEKFNIKVATENMFQHDKNRNYLVKSTCASAAEFKEYVDMCNSKWIVACVDIGHMALVGQDFDEMFDTLGSRIAALHVHDNNYIKDLHTLPFSGKLDFNTVTAALKRIGYNGVFTFEADNFLEPIPTELLDSALEFMQQTGRYLIKCITE